MDFAVHFYIAKDKEGNMGFFKDVRDDIKAVLDRDPAARNGFEVLVCYPGIWSIIFHRPAHWLYRHNAKLLARIISQLARWLTGVEIHPGAVIGKRCFIDHGMAIIIGETTEIGDDLTIYQGVTLGAKSFPKDENGNPVKGIKRHPNIEDDVIIYAGATILGGDVTVGRGSVIGGNTWLTKSVPPHSFITNREG